MGTRSEWAGQSAHQSSWLRLSSEEALDSPRAELECLTDSNWFPISAVQVLSWKLSVMVRTLLEMVTWSNRPDEAG